MVCQGLDEEEAASRLGVGGWWSMAWEVVAACVRHLDAEAVASGQQCEAEVPARDTAVGGGVRGELGDQVFGRLGDAVRQVPRAQPLGREQPGEAGAAWRGGQQDAEVVGRGVESAGLFLVHVTERGRTGLP